MDKKAERPRPLVLIILDGWGYSPNHEGNAIYLAKTPNIDRYTQEWPHTLLQAASEAVGLPEGQMGNSEVGHMNIGAGRVVYQDLPRINKDIRDGEFFKRPAFQRAIDHVKNNQSAMHYMGLLGPGGVHAHSGHLYALLDLARRNNLREVYIHTFLDGRDTPPTSGLGYLEELIAKIQELGTGQIATVGGRYFGMDREKNWNRTGRAYDAMVHAEAPTDSDPIHAVKDSYDKGVTDEFMIPTVIVTLQGVPVATIKEGDAVILYNFRTDRLRQIGRMLTEPDFDAWLAEHPPANHEATYHRGEQIKNLEVVTMTEYEKDLKVDVAYRGTDVDMPLAEVLSKAGLHQLHIAETAKYPHVTFFINGGREAPFPNEERILIPSPQVATYDLAPAMSADGIAEAVIETLKGGKEDVIILNFANGDMVGHSGRLDKVIEACEVVDRNVERVVEATLAAGGLAIITADHGNAEVTLDPKTGEPNTAHTTNPVPFIIVGDRDICGIKDGGKLANVAPTMLDILKLPKPSEMTEESLIEWCGDKRSPDRAGE